MSSWRSCDAPVLRDLARRPRRVIRQRVHPPVAGLARRTLASGGQSGGGPDKRFEPRPSQDEGGGHGYRRPFNSQPRRA